MEFFTILLSALMGIVSPAGFVLDRVAEDAIRDRLDSVEDLQVRIDNTPSYQILGGQVDRVRIAGRGIFPQPNMRIAALEVETDAIALNPDRLQQGRRALEKPLQAGIRLVLTRDDINRALQSPEIARQLRDLSFDLLGSSQSRQRQRYDLVNPQIDFLDNHRLRLRVTLQERNSDRQLQISAESGIAVMSGQRLQLIDPVIRANDQAIPEPVIQQLAAGFSRRFDLQRLENEGIVARILQVQVHPDRVAIAVFVRINPELPSSGN